MRQQPNGRYGGRGTDPYEGSSHRPASSRGQALREQQPDADAQRGTRRNDERKERQR